MEYRKTAYLFAGSLLVSGVILAGLLSFPKATSIIFVGLLAVFTLWACNRLVVENEGYYSTITIFWGGAFLYYLGISLEIYARDLQHANVAGIFISVTDRQLLYIALSGIVAVFAFSIGYKLSRFNPRLLEQASDGSDFHNPLPISLISLLVVTLVILLIFFSDELQLSSTYAGNYTVSYLSPVYGLLTGYLTIASTLLGALLVAKQTFLEMVTGLILFGLTVLWGVYSSNKDPILLVALALGAVYILRQKKQTPALFLKLISSAVILFIILNMVNALRYPESRWEEAFRDHSQSLLNFDPAGPFISLSIITQQPSEWGLGISYRDTIFLLVPRAVWPERPLDLSEKFARSQLVDWQPGQGLGYSLLSEAYYNFGWMGAFIQYALIGFLWGWFWRIIQFPLVRISPLYWRVTYLTFGYYLLIIMHRGPIAGIVKQGIIHFVLLLLLMLYFDWGRLQRVKLASLEQA
ncbi:MAG: hypothetical protein HC842_07580 [Cytophagales bacterium]|nr:hypothetical protein [Cytophagales bacterium]